MYLDQLGCPLWVTNGSQRRPRECRLSGVKRKQSAIKQTLGLLVSAGVLDTPFGKFARLQIVTIEDLFAGVKSAMPPEPCTPMVSPSITEAVPATSARAGVASRHSAMVRARMGA